MTGPRYSIIPARFFDDSRPRQSHYKVMGYLGKHSDKSGWMKLSQSRAAKDENLNLARETICRAIKDLVDWGYVEKRSKAETRRSICFYRILMDDPADPAANVLDLVSACAQAITGGCDEAITGGCDARDHNGCDVWDHNKNDPSSMIKRKKARAGVSAVESSAARAQVVSCFTISSQDASWDAWMKFFRASGEGKLADAAERALKFDAPSRWPHNKGTDIGNVYIPEPPTLTAQSRRSAGEHVDD